MKIHDHLNNAYKEVLKKRQDDVGRWSDIVDDMMPAFGNVPGRKMHVSFGGI